MTPIQFFDAELGKRLSQTMKAVRRFRGLTSAQVSEAMGMPLRSFQHFESGKGRVDLEKLDLFARVLGTDPFALLLAAQIGSPRFAVRAAGNKAALALIIALEELDRDAGDRMLRLDTATLFGAMSEALRKLADDLKRGDELDPSRLD